MRDLTTRFCYAYAFRQEGEVENAKGLVFSAFTENPKMNTVRETAIVSKSVFLGYE